MVVQATIGVLALQGAFQKHLDMLARLDQPARAVRYPEQLADCAGLILPGGESTTMSRLLRDTGLLQPLREYACEHPLFGTCAGLILMAERVEDPRVEPLGVLPMRAERNRYGRQIDSFTAPLQLAFDADGPPFPGVFIRAPAASELGEEIEVLARHQGQPVLLAAGAHLAAAFHPELTDDPRVHRHWLQRIAAASRPQARAAAS
ncbi:pyridoxal 5'-phosphate synthase glutaminase subunit PdxT [Thiohalobacter sp. IOR34]|uniref:pyridoxal 5'-phosphate synthase glutaminase subunit PdxT n=1 Tax=Thiohalobacter sp. IOR34 TaxID=3057176 RepID=UPI0025B12763|nr:pyridoxal 5'-phosphate synthase glutaminase subunit PdxT [Thiohalobacter sp. IOR34]WJW74994.1 pyridoxal 5'-phosphate synthase glutaminase subunit PdxT [Thiohalobacter sp. IOR34]